MIASFSHEFFEISRKNVKNLSQLCLVGLMGNVAIAVAVATINVFWLWFDAFFLHLFFDTMWLILGISLYLSLCFRTISLDFTIYFCLCTTLSFLSRYYLPISLKILFWSLFIVFAHSLDFRVFCCWNTNKLYLDTNFEIFAYVLRILNWTF